MVREVQADLRHVEEGEEAREEVRRGDVEALVRLEDVAAAVSRREDVVAAASVVEAVSAREDLEPTADLSVVAARHSTFMHMTLLPWRAHGVYRFNAINECSECCMQHHGILMWHGHARRSLLRHNHFHSGSDMTKVSAAVMLAEQ